MKKLTGIRIDRNRLGLAAGCIFFRSGKASWYCLYHRQRRALQIEALAAKAFGFPKSLATDRSHINFYGRAQ